MEKKIKKTSNEKRSLKPIFHYAYQEFIHLNQINIEELPELQKEMALAIEKQLTKASTNCTNTHFNIVKESLQAFADILEEFFENEYAEQIEGNIIPTIPKPEEEEKPKQAELKLVQKIQFALEQKGRDYLNSSELINLGVQGVNEGKAIIIDELLLYREYLTNKWFVGSNPMKGGQS